MAGHWKSVTTLFQISIYGLLRATRFCRCWQPARVVHTTISFLTWSGASASVMPSLASGTAAYFAMAQL